MLFAELNEAEMLGCVADATVRRTPVDVERRQEASIVINHLNAYGKPSWEDLISIHVLNCALYRPRSV